LGYKLYYITIIKIIIFVKILTVLGYGRQLIMVEYSKRVYIIDYWEGSLKLILVEPE